MFPPSVLWHLSAIIWRRFLAQSRTTRVARSLSTNGWWWLISGSISISVSIACDPNYIQSERASFGTLRVYLLLTAVINARRKRVWHPLSALSAHENWTNVHCAAEKSVEHVGKWLKLKISIFQWSWQDWSSKPFGLNGSWVSTVLAISQPHASTWRPFDPLGEWWVIAMRFAAPLISALTYVCARTSKIKSKQWVRRRWPYRTTLLHYTILQYI